MKPRWPPSEGRHRSAARDRPLRVVVAEDSLTVRKHLVASLESLDGFEVVAEASDGVEAVEACRQLEPDVVTMDMMMPGLDGLQATERIMAECPTPILIVSSSANRGEAFRTFDALAAGAVDVLEKPGSGHGDEWVAELGSRLRMVSRIPVITHVRGLRTARAAPGGSSRSASVADPGPVPGEGSGVGIGCVLVGASTGGPGALQRLFSRLPADFDLPILTVLHLPDLFATTFIDWLGDSIPFEVRFARHGESLPTPGRAVILVAPCGHHLQVRRGRLELDRGPERLHCRPSVDVLFESAAEELGPSLAACLLTGMGQDGARGLLAIRRHGGLTMAQDEASSVVYGMPGEAARIGAAAKVLALEPMADLLAGAAARARRGRVR